MCASKRWVRLRTNTAGWQQQLAQGAQQEVRQQGKDAARPLGEDNQTTWSQPRGAWQTGANQACYDTSLDSPALMPGKPGPENYTDAACPKH